MSHSGGCSDRSVTTLRRDTLESLRKRLAARSFFFVHSFIYQRKNLDSGYVRAYVNDSQIARYLSTGGYHKHSTMSRHILDRSVLNMQFIFSTDSCLNFKDHGECSSQPLRTKTDRVETSLLMHCFSLTQVLQNPVFLAEKQAVR